ncbi:MAG TPA: aminopeptidase P family protein [Clostridia bacterium]|nr:aminopeptidase P family protein [Clostridia bacterium]
MTVSERVKKLRELMAERHIDAYIIPSFDAHQSEYVPEHWKARQWISGFTGSAGTVVVTMEEAGLWTDGRYFIQAEKQLEGSPVKLFKMGLSEVPTYPDWINELLPVNGVVGFNGKSMPVSIYKDMVKLFKGKELFFETGYDLIGQLWEDRPAIPRTPIFLHDIKYAGKSRTEKLTEVRSEMQKQNAGYYLLSSLDDVAWLLNLRGGDVPNTPVVTAYVLISQDSCKLFIDNSKVSSSVKKELEADKVEVLAYEAIEEAITSIKDSGTISMDPEKSNVWLYKAVPGTCEILELPNISTNLKAVKNSTEIENLRNSHIKDGAALVKFHVWLDKHLGKEKITEITVDEKLKEFRGGQELSMGPSFDTIAGYKEHAAMMHYKAVPGIEYTLEKEGMLLIDSGGQYLDGTTDTTRTIVLGKLTGEQKKDFTLVLKSHIGLATAKFMYGCTCTHLDILARRPLWEEGLDYRCGTGHGVGYLLSVHEGPHGFKRVPAVNTVVLEPGMIITNEPGIYKEGKHGVRTENTLLVAEDFETEYGRYLKFDTISYCPIDLDGIDASMLTQQEKDWLNNYHREVYEKLAPCLDEEEKAWLKHETRAV